MILECGDEKELQHNRDKAMMLKCICLDEMNKPILLNMSKATKRDKVKLQVEVERKWGMPDDEILAKFNELCIQTIFDPNYETDHLPCAFTGEREDPIEKPVEQEVI
jgi:hypothetical protein